MAPISGATRFHLLRHAEHVLQGRALVGRQPGVKLSASGKGQVEALAEFYGRNPVDVVISSPIGRARDTAAPIATRMGLPLGIDEGFNEIDFGQWTGMGFDALEGRADWQAWNRFRGMAPTPGGETMAQAQQRAVAALARLRTAWPNAEVLVVSHADVLKAVLAQVLGLALDLMHRFDLAPGCRAVLTLWDDAVRVDGLNLPPE